MPFNNAVDASQSGYQSITSGGVWNGRTFQAGAGISLINADGTAGNTTITATGMVPDPFATSYLYDDFLFCANSVETGDTAWFVTGGQLLAGEAAHPGIMRIGAAGSLGYIIKSKDTSAQGPIVLGAGVLTIDYLVRIVGTNDATTCIGLGIGATNAEPTDGVYFLYSSGVNSGNWVGKTANASTRSSANSADAVVGGQWDRLRIVVNAAATSVSYFVNGVEITNSPLTTNIPTDDLSLRVNVTSSGGGDSCDVDLMVFSYVLTTPR
jgi:hypothetical protein